MDRLMPWEKALLYPLGTGDIRVTRLDGTTNTFEKIRYEANRMEDGFLVMEEDARDPRVFHVANVDFWEVVY